MGTNIHGDRVVDVPSYLCGEFKPYRSYIALANGSFTPTGWCIKRLCGPLVERE